MLAIGIAPHLVASGRACERSGDQRGCTDFVPFAGLDATVHYWLLDFLAVGGRFAGSKDLDASEGASDDGITWDPEDQSLWRLTAEVRFNPPLLPLWVGAHGGLALLVESREWHSGSDIRSASETRAAPLAGLAVGCDFWLGESFTLAPEARGSLIAFGEPPEFRTNVEGRDYGPSAWFDVALRLSYVIP